MDISQMVIWLKRATGIGYSTYKPIAEEIPAEDASKKLKDGTDRIVWEMRQLERELRGIGYRIHRGNDYGD